MIYTFPNKVQIVGGVTIMVSNPDSSQDFVFEGTVKFVDSKSNITRYGELKQNRVTVSMVQEFPFALDFDDLFLRETSFEEFKVSMNANPTTALCYQNYC